MAPVTLNETALMRGSSLDLIVIVNVTGDSVVGLEANVKKVPPDPRRASLARSLFELACIVTALMSVSVLVIFTGHPENR